MVGEVIKNKISTLPLCPGVYLMKDRDGNIIYVGKSKVLKNRVSQYFQNSAAHSPKTRVMVSQISDFEYIVTDTEAEALALECNLIKKHRPKYNILLKDDKQYPYIKITANEEYPRIFMTRKLQKDGGLYFGPFMTAFNVKEAVEEMRKIFLLRNCSKKFIEDNPQSRTCLYYHLGQCSAPCCGMVSKDNYSAQVKKAIAFLNGNHKTITDELEKSMVDAAEALEFEKAAALRDKILRIKTLGEKQNISSAADGNMDFIGIYKENDNYCIQVFYYRKGSAVGSEYFTLENEQSTEKEVLESFVKQFYFTQAFIPSKVYIFEELEDKESIEEWMSGICGHKVSFIVPKRGDKLDIMKMVLKNAQESFLKEQFLKNRNESYQNRMMAQLKELLKLDKIPFRIESYDISHFSGSSATGVQIVYHNAAPDKKSYRKYNIKTVSDADDYQSMREVISRRINEAYIEEDLIKTGVLAPENAKFLPLPDLIFLDGGKGHVSSVKMLLDTFGEDIPLYGLVKDGNHKTRGIVREDEELILDKNSELFKFLACMQDEVHRFAITATRKKHQKSNIKSRLESVPGVGPATRKKLLKKFGGITGVKNAEFDELASIVGEKLAKNIKEYFSK